VPDSVDVKIGLTPANAVGLTPASLQQPPPEPRTLQMEWKRARLRKRLPARSTVDISTLQKRTLVGNCLQQHSRHLSRMLSPAATYIIVYSGKTSELTPTDPRWLSESQYKCTLSTLIKARQPSENSRYTITQILYSDAYECLI